MIESTKFQVKSETILRGHQNWVTSLKWFTDSVGDQKLVTCSMDKSIIVWGETKENGIWEDQHNLGEMGGGNMGFLGIVTGLDSHGKRAIMTHSYSGSLHLWWEIESGKWKSAPSPSGHYSSVRDLSWCPLSNYLLSTSYDQTTRLYAKVNICFIIFFNSNTFGRDLWIPLSLTTFKVKKLSFLVLRFINVMSRITLS